MKVVILRQQFGALDKNRLSRLQSKFTLPIPQDFLDWLNEYNGAYPEGELGIIQFGRPIQSGQVRNIYGLNTGDESYQLDKMNEWLAGNVKSGRLAIAGDVCGNKYLIILKKGEVYFWDHDSGKEYFVRKSFTEFIEAIHNPSIGDDLEDILYDILKHDDVEKFKRFYQEHGYDWKTEDGSTLLEIAAIKAATKCIDILLLSGFPLGNALEYAENNAQYFDEHIPIVAKLRQYNGLNRGPL